jgi:hypothetical protein
MSSNVFISYSTADLPVAAALKSALESQPEPKFTAFLAETCVKVGEDLPKTITTAIAGCDFFVLLWSGNAASSGWVPQELGQAMGAGKPVFPIVLKEGITIPGLASTLKYLAAYKGEQEIERWVKTELADRARWNEIQKLIAVMFLVGLLAWVLTRSWKN